MRHRHAVLACTIAACALMTQARAQDDATVGRAVAQKQASEIKAGDPARWHQEDPGRQAALKTLQKEIGAAYDEARRACAKGEAAQRADCLQAARQAWQADLRNAPAQVDTAANMGDVKTRTVVSTPDSTTVTTTVSTPVSK